MPRSDWVRGDRSSWRGGVCCREIGGGAACGDEFTPERTTLGSWDGQPCCPAPPCDCATTKKGGRRGVRDGRANETVIGPPVLWRRGASGQGAAAFVVVDRIYEVAGARIEVSSADFPWGGGLAHPALAERAEPFQTRIRINLLRLGSFCDHGRRARYELASIRMPKGLPSAALEGGTLRWKLVASDRAFQVAHH